MQANSPNNLENDHYFADRKQYCIAFYNRADRNGKKAILAKYGQERGKQLLDQVKQEYETLLPQVPYVGEIDILKRQMLQLRVKKDYGYSRRGGALRFQAL